MGSTAICPGGGRGDPRSAHPRGRPIAFAPPSSCRGATRSFRTSRAWILGTFHGVSKKHMPRYLDEFSYRFNRRWRETELFGFVPNRAVQGEPFPYSRLTAELFG